MCTIRNPLVDDVKFGDKCIIIGKEFVPCKKLNMLVENTPSLRYSYMFDPKTNKTTYYCIEAVYLEVEAEQIGEGYELEKLRFEFCPACGADLRHTTTKGENHVKRN